MILDHDSKYGAEVFASMLAMNIMAVRTAVACPWQLSSVRQTLTERSVRWAVTGGPAAYALQRFYQGVELPLFIDSFNDQIRSKLRLIPDKAGPLIFLRSFGTVPFWRETEPFPVAHPWFIYAELMYSPDARAHEAAEELKHEFLSN